MPITQTAINRLVKEDPQRALLVRRINTYLNHLDGVTRRGELLREKQLLDEADEFSIQNALDNL